VLKPNREGKERGDTELLFMKISDELEMETRISSMNMSANLNPAAWRSLMQTASLFKTLIFASNPIESSISDMYLKLDVGYINAIKFLKARTEVLVCNFSTEGCRYVGM